MDKHKKAIEIVRRMRANGGELCLLAQSGQFYEVLYNKSDNSNLREPYDAYFGVGLHTAKTEQWVDSNEQKNIYWLTPEGEQIGDTAASGENQDLAEARNDEVYDALLGHLTKINPIIKRSWSEKEFAAYALSKIEKPDERSKLALEILASSGIRSLTEKIAQENSRLANETKVLSNETATVARETSWLARFTLIIAILTGLTLYLAYCDRLETREVKKQLEDNAALTETLKTQLADSARKIDALEQAQKVRAQTPIPPKGKSTKGVNAPRK